MTTKESGSALSYRRQITATVDLDGAPLGEYEPYEHMDAARAVELLEGGSHWIRSANLEFYYRYATIEDADSGQRFVVRNPDERQWAIILKWLAHRCEHTTVVFEAGGTT